MAIKQSLEWSSRESKTSLRLEAVCGIWGGSEASKPDGPAIQLLSIRPVEGRYPLFGTRCLRRQPNGKLVCASRSFHW